MRISVEPHRAGEQERLILVLVVKSAGNGALVAAITTLEL